MFNLHLTFFFGGGGEGSVYRVLYLVVFVKTSVKSV